MRPIEDVLRAHPGELMQLNLWHKRAISTQKVHAWVDFMMHRYTVPEGLDHTLVLLPCSERKPYRLSKSHRKFTKPLAAMVATKLWSHPHLDLFQGI